MSRPENTDPRKLNGDPGTLDSGTSDPVQSLEELTRLRNLLVGEEQERLTKLENRKQRLSAEDIGGLLPQAIALKSGQDDALSHALRPAVEEGLKDSVQRNPQTIIDVVFPILGPAIRKAVSQSMRGLAETINKNVEYTFTLRGLRWRMKAWRSGRSISEVILAESTEFRTEQVFFIHRETGLLLAHVSAPELGAQPNQSELISSMLTAIQDFVQDSFGVDRGEKLEEFRVGELLVLAEQGPHATLAAVVRGDPPSDFPVEIQECLEKLHSEFRGSLQEFDGDNTPFTVAEPRLEDLLISRVREIKRSPWIPLLVALLIAALGIWGLMTFFNTLMRNRTWNRFVEKVEETPGYVVMDEGKDQDGKFFLRGLKDPWAPDPEGLLAEADMSPDRARLAFAPWQAPVPEYVERRALQVLNPPPLSGARFKDGVLVLAGWSDEDLAYEGHRLASLMPAVRQVDAGAVFGSDAARGSGDAALAVLRQSVPLSLGRPVDAGFDPLVLNALAEHLNAAHAALESERTLVLALLEDVPTDADQISINKLLDALRERGVPRLEARSLPPEIVLGSPRPMRVLITLKDSQP